MNSQEYYKLLGIEENASELEIKEAYRIKAKEYHPDLNHAPEAAELFIKITEAYHYAIEKHAFINKLRDYIVEKDKFDNRWREERRRKAQEYARRQSKMKYEKFEKSFIYKSANLFFSMYDYIIFFLGIFMVISSIFGVYITVKAEKFNADTVAISTFGILVGSLFIIFTFKRFRRNQ